MQGFLAKYATAAHLALLAVAPLFLFPSGNPDAVGTVVLWLAGFCLLWTVLAPSPRADEMPHEARARVSGELVRDPMVWIACAVIVLAAVRWSNGGVALTYDAETSSWRLRAPVCAFLPGSVSGMGFAPWTAAVAGGVMLVGLRHALGSTARAAFFVWTAALSGLAASAALAELALGNAVVVRIAACDPTSPEYVGTAFGVMLLISALALFETLARGWSTALPFAAFSLGANMLALLAFAPSSTVAVFLAVFLVLTVWMLVFVFCRGSVRLRWQLPLALTLVLLLTAFFDGSVLVGTPVEKRLPERVVAARTYFPAGFFQMRAALSDASVRICRAAPWTGRGLGAFPLALRFAGDDETWRTVPARQEAPLNGWLGLMAERGILGSVPFVLFAVFLVWAYVRSFARDRAQVPPAHPERALLPLTALALVTVTFKDCSLFRVDVLLATLAALTVPVRSGNLKTEVANG